MTHFELFGLQPHVDVDVSALEAKHRALSMQLHPDRLPPSADGATRRRAVEQTTNLNEALKVLKDPTRRALYLLGLHGVDLEHRQMPLPFLEEIMERRERLDAARARKALAEVTAMAREVEALRDRALAAAQAALRTLPQGLEMASAELAAVKYYQRFLEEVEAIEEESHP